MYTSHLCNIMCIHVGKYTKMLTVVISWDWGDV